METRWYWLGQAMIQYKFINLSSCLPANLLSIVSIYLSISCKYFASMSQAHSLAASLAWQVHLSSVFSILLVKQYISIQYILPASLLSSVLSIILYPENILPARHSLTA